MVHIVAYKRRAESAMSSKYIVVGSKLEARCRLAKEGPGRGVSALIVGETSSLGLRSGRSCRRTTWRRTGSTPRRSRRRGNGSSPRSSRRRGTSRMPRRPTTFMNRCDLAPTPQGLVPGASRSLHVPYMLATCEAKESGNYGFGKELTGVDP